MKKNLLGLLAGILIVTQAKAYIVSYTRLYNPTTKKSVDILGDCHIRGSLSDDELLSMPIGHVKQGAYPSERKFLESLEFINQHSASDTAVVGETAQYAHHGTRVFLGYLHRLVRDTAPAVIYKDSDTTRRSCYMGSCTLGWYRKQFPLADGSIVGMIINSGTSSWRAFYRLFTTVVQKPANDHPTFNEFCRLADVEMILHILSLPQKHIVVYCGYWHADNIAQFLIDKVGYSSIYSHHMKKWEHNCREIDLDHLWPLTHTPEEIPVEESYEPKKGFLGNLFQGLASFLGRRSS